ncbi:MAG: 6,7-dimethyl-8-ribityllumazine synthase [Bradymonadaceae bacterium]
MTDVIEGDVQGGDAEFAIVAARWHERFGRDLIEGAVGELTRHGVAEAQITVVRCPGSFELPQTASTVVDELDVDAVVCLGVLIRGETPHFDYIADEATRGIGAVAREADIPVVYGVLTCDTMEQAMARSGSKAGNKGTEAARAALEMSGLYDRLERR